MVVCSLLSSCNIDLSSHLCRLLSQLLLAYVQAHSQKWILGKQISC